METKIELYEQNIQVQSDKQYKLISYKTVKDISGNDVQVEDRIEIITVKNLEAEKARLIELISAIDAKLNKIKTL
jgi:hypothetical protein